VGVVWLRRKRAGAGVSIVTRTGCVQEARATTSGTRGRRTGDQQHRANWLAGAVAFVLMSANLALITVAFGVAPAAADTAPVDPLPETVSAAALPTVQINGVVWNQVIVGNRVYATGQFSQARPAGAAANTNQTPRSNILAYDLNTGVMIPDWAPTLNAQGMELAASADGRTIYVGGDFTLVNNTARNRIAALDAQTANCCRSTRARTVGSTRSRSTATPSTSVATSRLREGPGPRPGSSRGCVSPPPTPAAARCCLGTPPRTIRSFRWCTTREPGA